MKSSGSQFILVRCLIASEPAASLAQTMNAGAAPKPKLTILVYNDCHVPGETVSNAFLRARRIFFHAGIETD